MTVEAALDLVRDAFLVSLLTAAPILLIGLVVGLFVSLVQSVTQLQEQTLAFVPKVLAMVVAASLFMGWIAERMLEYTSNMLGRLLP